MGRIWNRLQALINRAVDKYSADVAHEVALRRHRQILSERSMQYAAAKTNRLTGAWTTQFPNVNDIISASSPAVRARVNQLVRDFPYFARALNNIVDYTVGPGIVYQSRVKMANGKLDKKRNQIIEDAFKWWADEADASGKLHYYDMMRLAKRQDAEIGEFLIVMAPIKDPNRYLPLALQIYEANWLTSARDNYGTGGIGMSANPGETEIRQGVEYEKLTGRVKGYWFCDPYHGGQEVYISADQVIHGFDMLRPQQLRGISQMAPGVLLAHDLHDYMGAEIDGAKFAAKYLAFVKKQQPSLGQGLGGVTRETGEKGITRYIEELENAIVEYLKPGDDVVLAKSERPGTTFTPFVRLLLTMLSVTTGVPYELMTGDYQGINFSTCRIIRNDFQQQLRPISIRHIRQFGLRTQRGCLDWAVLTGKINLPGYFQNPRHYWESEWQPPGMEAVDPLREAKSQVEAIRALLKSPQEVARERGRDLEDVYREIKEAMDLAEQYGLPFDLTGIDTTLAPNPAAIMEE